MTDQPNVLFEICDCTDRLVMAPTSQHHPKMVSKCATRQEEGGEGGESIKPDAVRVRFDDAVSLMM